MMEMVPRWIVWLAAVSVAGCGMTPSSEVTAAAKADTENVDEPGCDPGEIAEPFTHRCCDEDGVCRCTPGWFAEPAGDVSQGCYCNESWDYSYGIAYYCCTKFDGIRPLVCPAPIRYPCQIFLWNGVHDGYTC